MSKKVEKELLTTELYKSIIEANNSKRMELKENQAAYNIAIDSINNDLDILNVEMESLQGKMKLLKRSLKKEKRRLFRTDRSLSILNRKTNKLNKLFSRNSEEKIYSSRFVLRKTKK